MVNLLPPQAKRQIIMEYYIRVASVWMFGMTAALLVLLILLIPIYTLITLQLGTYEIPFASAAAEGSSFTEAGQSITSANELAGELARIAALPPASRYLGVLEELTTSDITITAATIERNNGVVNEVAVTGVATTRAALAAFRDRLEASDTFTKVELPLSNLAKDRAVPFSIVVTVAPPAL